MFKTLRMSCRTVRRDLWDYAGERLSEGPMEQVEHHLKRCAACRQEVEALRKAQQMLEVTRQQIVPPPATGWNELQNRLVAEGLATTAAPLQSEPMMATWAVARPHPDRRRAFGSWSMVTAASSFAVVLITGALIYRMRFPQFGHAEAGRNRPILGANPAPSSARDAIAKGREEPTRLVKQEPDRNMKRTPSGGDLERETPSTGGFQQVVANRPEPSSPRGHMLANPPHRREAARSTPMKSTQNTAHKNEGARPSGMQFEPHKPTPEEGLRNQEQDNQDSRRDFVMGSLVPVSHDDDAY